MPIVMYKRIGETPLQCLDRLRVEQPKYAEKVNGVPVPLTYAGRLDPMAEGVLLVLAGEECKEKEMYLGLDKEYECEILWGVSTDTHDILGLITQTSAVLEKEIQEKLPIVLKSFVGKFQQDFPAYSSKPVQGKPLFQWARDGQLDEIEIPSKEVEGKSLELVSTRTFEAIEIENIILERINMVKGDFRQADITQKWEEYFAQCDQERFFVTKISVKCSSGTYIRSLVEKIGQKMTWQACVFGLFRKSVGEYL